jgi:SulP family sulfate permease
MPKDVLIYEIAGPLFFGAAQKAMSALQRVPTGIKVVVLDLAAVPVMDATGLVSLESTVTRLHSLGMFVVLGGVQGQPLRVLARSGLREHRDRISVHRSMERALAVARERSAGAGKAAMIPES